MISLRPDGNSRPRPLLAVLVIAVVLFVLFLWLGRLPSAEWVLHFDHAGILLGYVLACIAAAGGILSLFYRAEIRTFWRRVTRRDSGFGASLDRFRDQIDAIVLPVSPRTEQPSWIIEHLRPEYVALLYSEASREQAFEIERAYDQRTSFVPAVRDLEQRVQRLTDPHSLEESRHLTRVFVRLFRDQLHIPRHRIFVDITGGTKPMSLGAFQAAEDMQVSSIYVLGKASLQDRRGPHFIVDPSDPAHGDPRFMSDWTSAAGEG